MRIPPRLQGDIGELSAMSWLVDHGATVFLPVGHSPDVDLVADFGDQLVRVQVKTSNYLVNDRYSVTIATRGGNQSWSGLVKRFDPRRCDYVFVHVGDGRRWFIPAAVVEGGTGMLLGGPKYQAYEVEPGRTLEDLAQSRNAKLPDPPAGYPSGQRDETVNLAAQPSQVRILLPP